MQVKSVTVLLVSMLSVSLVSDRIMVSMLSVSLVSDRIIGINAQCEFSQ